MVLRSPTSTALRLNEWVSFMIKCAAFWTSEVLTGSALCLAITIICCLIVDLRLALLTLLSTLADVAENRSGMDIPSHWPRIKLK